MIIIIGFRIVIASPDKPDCDDKSHLTLKGISDVDHSTNNEDHGPFEWIYVIFGTDFCTPIIVWDAYKVINSDRFRS